MRLFHRTRRFVDRFLEDPASLRNAALLMIGATFAVVVVGAVIVTVFDHREFPNIGRALWFTLQSVTTVGYGDVTPARAVGRVVAAVVMVTGIGFLTIITAAITSTFVEASRQRAERAGRSAAATAGAADLAAAVAAMTARLADMEATLALLVEQTRSR